MITASTRITPVRPENGTLMDLNPYRRAARLRAAGISLQRTGPWSYTVELPDGRTERRRTFTGAQRVAHAFADPSPRR